MAPSQCGAVNSARIAEYPVDGGCQFTGIGGAFGGQAGDGSDCFHRRHCLLAVLSRMVKAQASCIMTASPKPFTIRWNAPSASWLRWAAGNRASEVARSDVRATRPCVWLRAVESR